jgi:riboflavin kinase / FMN adenylyltransferase
MKIFRGLPAVHARVPVALTIGNFDGVHRGHQALLAQVVAAARARALSPAVMTFEPHPREFFAPEQAPARVSNLRDKIDALAAAGIERVFIQHFNRRFAQLSADSFIEQVLVDGCRARWLMIGDDFRFGARRTGDVVLLRARAAAGGYEVVQSDTVCDNGERISSSAVRSALASGDLPLAQQLLGRPYAISARVQHGAKLGRRIGFPTLNLRIAHARKMRRPALHGVFAVRIHGLGPTARSGVASMGLRPTVDDSGRWLLEVHVFDFAEQVYGRLVRIEFVRKLRDEIRYDTLAELTHAIGRDADHARALLSSLDETPALRAQATI